MALSLLFFADTHNARAQKVTQRKAMSSAPASSNAQQQGDDNGGASSLQVDSLKVGVCFSSSEDLRTAAERALLSKGRRMVCNHRTTGS